MLYIGIENIPCMTWQVVLITNRMNKFLITEHNVLSSAWITYARILANNIDIYLIDNSTLILTTKGVGCNCNESGVCVTSLTHHISYHLNGSNT